MKKRSTFTLQVTERCNLACEYCYVRTRKWVDPNDCSLDLCRSFINFALRESGSRVKIAFFGGEPLLRPDLIQYMVDYGKQAAHEANKTIGFHIVTNGTLLVGQIADFIAKENISVEVSIDGPQEIHDCNRPYIDGSGSFQTTYANLIRFREQHPKHKIHLFSVITETKATLWLHSLLEELKISSFTFNPVYLSPEQEVILGRKCLSITESIFMDRVERYREQFLQGNTCFDEGINHNMSFFFRGKAVRICEVGLNTTITTRSGKIYPCPFFVGHEDQIIGDIWKGFDEEKVRPYIIRNVNSQESCSQCNIKFFCGGGCAFSAYQRSGSINTPWVDFCSVQKRYAEKLEESVIMIGSRKPEALLSKIGNSLMKAPRPQPTPTQQVSFPTNFVVRLTGKCNLACDYCYETDQRAANDYLDKATARSIIDYIVGSPCKESLLCIFGGEPLLNWETGRFLIETLADESIRHGKKPFFHIVTNGTLITRDIAQSLAHSNTTVQISIDGLEYHHDLHRKRLDGSGSYVAMLRGVEILREVNPQARIDAQVVLTPENMNMVGIVKALKTQGFRRIRFLKCTELNNWAVEWSSDDVHKLIEARKEFFPFYLQSVAEGRVDVDMDFGALIASQPQGPKGLCECGRVEVFVDTKGDIYPCSLMYFPGKLRLGNCSTSDPWAGLQLPVRSIERDIECSECWAYSRCMGGCAVHCQKCGLFSSKKTQDNQRLWCDLMRAEFARAIIAYRLIEQRYPKQLETLRSIFRNFHSTAK